MDKGKKKGGAKCGGEIAETIEYGDGLMKMKKR